MLFNENINYSNTQNTELILSQLNLFISDIFYDEQKMLKICNLIAELKINSITVNHLFVSKIWKWLEKTNIKIYAYFNLDNFIVSGSLNNSAISMSIRNAIADGASIIDIEHPNNIPLQDILDLLVTSIDCKTELIKLTIDKHKINSTDKIKFFLDTIYKKNISHIKTEPFIDTCELNNNFQTEITDINSIIDFIHEQKIENTFKLDIVSNNRDKNGFNFYNSVDMLYQSVFDNNYPFYKNCIFTRGPLGLNKILQ